ncbi:rhodanese-like domain-containing protein [Nodularia sphaerocarpa]|uniref:rhodanese-like domain-containing protein n=1 Tax=Nodularia sphaerocarpa TaxID=137816 RepID=UPI001EFC29AF|nr:rhodanese-like domain-containing protein [Nodularia sphaerocarpa]MDB9372140.1 rhodanese-like domain-containing protein [Nodularia sphaerocarpa CS-585]MDB9380568.1 rhodanese-like domain-containing protein [Nodularia sphaerocarpa CS-585A2]ULP70846.1 Sulfurtransferase [Nodularia sphaerocarpa UHCC 0038]
MMFKKPIKTILLGFAICFCLLFGIGQNPSIAATITETNLKSGVDSFLTSIPAGYYTIANVEELKSFLKKNQTVLVDVREASEYRSGHIPNAINIPLRTLAQNLNQIPRDRPVVLYCSSGYRSAMGVMTLHLLGYENVLGFPPSFVAWKTAGEAIAKKS